MKNLLDKMLVINQCMISQNGINRYLGAYEFSGGTETRIFLPLA